MTKEKCGSNEVINYCMFQKHFTIKMYVSLFNDIIKPVFH